MSVGFSKKIRKYIISLVSKIGLSRFLDQKIIVRIDGGLASQMHQFALGLAIAKKVQLPLYFDISFFETDSCDIKGIKNRYFWLTKTFPRIQSAYCNHFISQNQISKRFIKRFSDTCIDRKATDFSPELFEKRPWYVRQYYHNAQYINTVADELRNFFSFNIELNPQENEWKEQIVSSQSCSVHIRKGDFVNSVHDVCTDDYYLNAIKEVDKRHPDAIFFIFSNDEAYARNLLSMAGLPDSRICHICGRNEIDPRVDLYLLSLCRHSIISNSGFSWFPAFLAKHNEQVVIMPEYWTADAKLKEHSRLAYYQDAWIIMSV